MVSRKSFGKKQAIPRYIFAFIVIVAGIILEYIDIEKEFLGFQSVGTWLIYVGFVMLAIITLSMISQKKKIVDERMEKIAYKSSRVTFLFVIIGAFVVMIWDGISKIEVSYSMFMSHMIAWIVLVYFVAYKILERYN